MSSSIRIAAMEIQSKHPGLRVGATLRNSARYDLERLAVGCGLPARMTDEATSNDLLGIYTVALRDVAAAQRTAQRVADRLAADSLNPAPTPSPLKEDISPAPGMGKAEVLSIMQQVLGPLQTAIDQHHDEVTGKLNAFEDDLNGVEARVLTTTRELLPTLAQDIVAKALREMQPMRLVVEKPLELVEKDLGLVHKDTPKLIAALNAGLNVYLHGPAGSGKTTGAQKASEALGVPFYFAAKVESEYQLVGFKDARGETVRTQFREAYEHGGVFLFDEMDASAPSAVVAMNAALANGVCAFPDGTVKRHKNFYAVAGGNTKLTGATRAYVGRSQLDAASIDRWVFIEWGYDEQLEQALATNANWCAHVQKVRAEVAKRGLNHLVTPRATYDGCKLLAANFDWDTVLDMVVYKGLDADTKKQLEEAVNGGGTPEGTKIEPWR